MRNIFITKKNEYVCKIDDINHADHTTYFEPFKNLPSCSVKDKMIPNKSVVTEMSNNNILSSINNFLDANSMHLSSVMEYFGIIMVTLFIPLAILLIEKTANPFEQRTIFRYVINARKTSWFLILLAVSYLFWGMFQIKILSLLLFITSIWLFITILKTSYYWLVVGQAALFGTGKNNIKDTLIAKYLEKADDLENKKEDWESIWNDEWKSNAESKLIIIYMKFINNLKKKKSYDYLYQSIDVYSHYFDKRLFFFPKDREIFLQNILSWYKDFHDKIQDPDCLMTKIALENIIRKSIKYFMNRYSELVFKVIQQHLKDKDSKYIDELMCSCICRTFFNNIASSPESEVIWGVGESGYFPDEWKVTLSNLNDKSNFMSKVWLKNFIMWKVSIDNDSLSKNLNNIIKGLFPDVDPREWEYLLNFLQYPNDMFSLLNQNMFVVSLRARAGWYDGKTNLEDQWQKEMKKEENNAYSLFIHLFKSNFNKELLNINIERLEREDFEGMSDMIKLRKDQYLRIFKELVERLNDMGA